MKRTVHHFLIWALLLVSSNVFAVQLSGSYTINPLATATATNFQNIRSAVTYLTSTGTRADGGPANSGTVGVAGPVEFIISAGTFNEQVIIPAITGASSTSTVTFRGAGRANTIFTFASTDASNRHTLKLNLATYVTFRDMTIRGTGSVAWVVHLQGANTNFNSFRNCNIQVNISSASSSNWIAVVINNSATSATTGTRIDGTVIDSCLIESGYYGICAVGSSGNLHVGFRVSNTQIMNSYYMSIYNSFINGFYAHNNLIMPLVSYLYNYGIYMINSVCTAPNKHIITNNRIHNFGYYGVYISGSSNLSGNKGLFANNMIGGGIKYEYGYGIYFASSSQWSMAHNSFNYDLAGYNSTYGPVYFTGGTNISFRNNICATSVASQSLAMYASASAIFDTMDYNLFYRPDTTSGVLVFIGGNLNSGSFKGAGGHNLNSMYGNPSFPNDTAHRVGNSCFQGISIAYAAIDYYGTTRSLTNPTIGPYEAPFVTNNVAVLSILQPTAPITPGSQDMWILFRNQGSNTVSSLNMIYRINNGTPDTATWFGSLASCAVDSVGFTGGNQVVLGNANNFKIYASMPNATLDNDRSNDTLLASFFTPLSGTYNIGGNTPDFAKPSDAFYAAQSAGITGSVTFIVHPGTYIDQVTIDNPITGLSAVNTITLVGTNRDSCFIRTDIVTGSARHVIRIGQSHIRVRNLTLRGNNGSFGWVVHINKNNTRNVQVKNCNIELTHPNAINTNSDVFMGVVMSGSNTSPYYYDTYVLDSIEIDSNNFRNGYAGVWQYSYYYNYYYTYGAPSIDIKVRNNTMTNLYYTGVFMNGLLSLNVSGNKIQFRKDGSTTVNNYGIYVQSFDATTNSAYTFIMNNNHVWNANYMAFNLYNCKANASNRGQFINNVGQTGFNLANSYGMYIYNQTNTDIHHNTAVNSMPATSSTQGAFYLAYSTGMRMRNNSFINSSPTTLAAPAYLVGNSFTSAAEFNYNNYYRADTNGQFVYINSWYSGTNFKGVGGNNVNSTVNNPFILNDTLPIPVFGCLNGDTIASILYDINDSLRASRGDIGAYEVPSPIDDAGALGIISPSFPVAAGAQNLVAKFINFGLSTLTSVNLSYTNNMGTPVTELWTGSLQTCDTSSVIFSNTKQISILPATIHNVKLYSSAPNLSFDLNNLNDTIEAILATPMRGVYIIGNAPSDFTNISSALASLKIRGVDSVVIFRIKTGTYTDQRFLMENILGVSETNTITFTSFANHVDSVVFVSNNTSTQNYLVLLQGARYIRFDKLTFQSVNSSFGRIVQLVGISSFNEFRNCKMISPVVSTTSANNTIVYGNPFSGNFMRFVGNTITGGSEVFNIFGTSTSILVDGFEIDSNIMSNQYARGGYFYYTSNLKFRNNNISTTSAYTIFYGLLSYYGDSSIEITGNRIFSTTANGYGITTQFSDGFNGKNGIIANNIIRIGTGGTSTNRAIADWYSSNMLIANNTAVVNGSSTTASHAGYFYYTGTISNTTRIRNNIFVNISTGNVLYHYNPTFASSQHNLVWTSGTIAIQRGTPANTYGNLQLFRAAVPSYETNSLQYRPGINTTTLLPVVSDTAVWAMNAKGIHLPEVSMDYAGVARPTSTLNGVPDIGAHEVTPTSVPPLCVAVPATPVAGGTQAFLFGLDTVAKITHDAFSTAPTSLGVRHYTGVRPPFSDSADYSLFAYLVTEAPSGFYTFNIEYFFKRTYLRNIPSLGDLRLAQKTPGNSWALISGSTLDTVRNFMSAAFLNTYDLFTGTDNFISLPVELTSFKGFKSQDNAILNWATATEVNVSHFELERSTDVVNFEQVAKITASGNSSQILNYIYEDLGAMKNQQAVYYRLRIVDIDGKFEYSNMIRISGDANSNNVTVGPNPFKNTVSINNISINDKVEVVDINGRIVASTQITQKDGTTRVSLSNSTPSGVYFLKISGDNNTVMKLIKE
jgi:hypothetical protein